MFIHLTTHSAYSLQEGLPLPVELAQAAKTAGMRAVGLTDHRLLSGSVEFVQACRQVGVQPILGVEIDLEGGSLLSLLAMDMQGWANLCRLSSSLALREMPEAACPFDLLNQYSNNLIALFGETGEETLQQLETLREIFTDRLYVALRQPSSSLQLSMLAHRLGLHTVVAQPIYYLSPDQITLQHTLAAIRLNLPLERLTTTAMAPPEAHFVSAGEMETRFSHFPDALRASGEIATRCQFDLPLGMAHMPVLSLPAGLTSTELLRRKAEQGANRLYGNISPAIRQRLDHELEVIARLGFEPIFLIVEDLLDFARRTGVPYSSRGSAASSLVAHCLGITSPDPLQLDLFFERFLNPARSTPPDIDTDLCSRRRDGVIRHVIETYGEERVAMVGTINRFRPRSALGEVAKAHGLAASRIREMVEQLPHGFWARMEEGPDGEEPLSSFTELRKAYPSPAMQHIFQQAEALLKLPRHLSVHAGGLVVAPGVLTDLVPVMHSGSKGVTITQFDLGSVEELGLVKIDLLGIRGLTVLGDVAEFIDANQQIEQKIQMIHGTEYASSLAVLETIPGDDPQTSSHIEKGETIGCFQIESPGMRATLREIHARSQDDLMVALALYRPGPLSGGMKESFVRRFKGEEPIEHLHPALAPLLEETFGVILYQEQVLRIAHDLAGFSLAEADLLRRAMSHFDPGRQMQMLENKFIAQAQTLSGVPPETGERVWEMMAAFAGYGFPKAHAASYAQVSWRSVWCKTHFPGEFMAAVLANWGGYYGQRVYLSEARRLGLIIRSPHVNFSKRNFVYAGDAQGNKVLFMGLDQVKDMTRRTIERIQRERPFRNLEDFLARVDPRPQEADHLARVGALEGFGSIPAILRCLETGRGHRGIGKKWQAGQPSLFEWQESNGDDWSLAEKVAAQQELLGLSLEAHPLELKAESIQAAGAIAIAEAIERIGQQVCVAGLYQSGHRSRTAKGETMMFLTLEDLSGMLDVVLFPGVYQQARSIIHTHTPLLVTGVIELDASRGEPLLRAEKVVQLG